MDQGLMLLDEWFCGAIGRYQMTLFLVLNGSFKQNLQCVSRVNRDNDFLSCWL